MVMVLVRLGERDGVGGRDVGHEVFEGAVGHRRLTGWSRREGVCRKVDLEVTVGGGGLPEGG